MNYIDATIFFPLGRLGQSFVAEFLSRYTDPQTGWAAAHWDDGAHTRRRQASLGNGTISPTPKYDAPIPELEDFTEAWREAHLIGHTITLGWPAAFLVDLQRDPQPEPSLFAGIEIQS